VLVSAGFDAHRNDPLAQMRVTESGFAALCAIVKSIAQRHAQGRLALVLEGGYDLDALAASVRACVDVLIDPAAHVQTADESIQPSAQVAQIIERVRQVCCVPPPGQGGG
jgi:acetoin utilization deacetylase AcuC-like enzyme